MKRFSKSIMLGALVAAVMAGCADDKTVIVEVPVTSSSSYYPIANGQGFVYRYVKLDSANVENAASMRFDSVSITSAGNYVGKSSFMETTYWQGGATGSMHVSKESNAAFRFMEPLALDSIIPINVSARWIKEADFNSNVNEWKTFDTSVINIPMSFGPDSGYVDASIKQTRTKSGTIPITFGTPARTVQAIEFTSTTNYKGKVTTAGVATLITDIDFNTVEKIYYADSIGIVKRHRDFTIIEAGPLSRNIPGFDYTLQTYKK
jgi:hypothetical protein